MSLRGSDSPELPHAPALDSETRQRLQDQSALLESMKLAFIVGPQRSGTTWILRAIANHPNAVARAESQVWPLLLSHVFALMRGYTERPAHAALKYLHFNDEDLALVARQLVDRQLLHYYESRWQKTTPIHAIVDKSPDHARCIPLLAKLYPWAKFILCTRDVRDCAVSFWKYTQALGLRGVPTDAEGCAVYYASEVYSTAIRAARDAGAGLGPGRFIEISYESHQASPAEELERVLRFIGLSVSPGILGTCVSKSSFEALTAGRKPGEEAVAAERKGVIGDWINHFSAEFGEQLLELARSNERSSAIVELKS